MGAFKEHPYVQLYSDRDSLLIRQAEALDRIAGILSDSQWSFDTLFDISEIIQQTGRKVTPMKRLA